MPGRPSPPGRLTPTCTNLTQAQDMARCAQRESWPSGYETGSGWSQGCTLPSPGAHAHARLPPPLRCPPPPPPCSSAPRRRRAARFCAFAPDGRQRLATKGRGLEFVRAMFRPGAWLLLAALLSAGRPSDQARPPPDRFKGLRECRRPWQSRAAGGPAVGTCRLRRCHWSPLAEPTAVLRCPSCPWRRG